MNRKALYALCICSFISGNLFAQFEKMGKEFDSYFNKQTQLFDSYISNQNAAFAKAMSESWKAFETQKQEIIRKEPVRPTIYNPAKDKKKPVTVKPLDPIAENTHTLEAPTNPTPPQNKPTPTPQPTLQREERTIHFSFHNIRSQAATSDTFTNFHLSNDSEQYYSKEFERLARSNYKGIVNSLEQLRSDYNLNDWFYYLLIADYCQALRHNISENEKTFLSLFLLAQSGYQIKLAKADNRLILLMPFREKLYSRPSLSMNGETFYINRTDVGSRITTYNTPTEGKIFTLRSDKPLTVPVQIASTTLALPTTNRSITIEYNSNLKNLMSSYPSTDVCNYALAPLSPEFASTLLPSLIELIKGKNRAEAANQLISFVQKTFKYQTDDIQFGYERAFFAEELFMYPYSDCEDRSVLFAQLVRTLLGLETILIEYPNHMATAVCFGNEEVTGDAIMFNNKRFLVCDPTYIGASIGRAMPEYKTTRPKVYELK